MADDTSSNSPAWRQSFDRFNTWRTELTEEAMALPQTMADLRLIIQDLRQVSNRLEKATEGLEMLLRRAESSGIAPMARQLDAAASEIEQQLRNLGAPGADQVVGRAVEDIQSAVKAFSPIFRECSALAVRSPTLTHTFWIKVAVKRLQLEGLRPRRPRETGGGSRFYESLQGSPIPIRRD